MEARLARVEPCQVDYYTQPVLANSCRLHEASETAAYRGGDLYFGPADVTWQTTAFRKIKYYTLELIGQSELDLPSQTLPTTAMWWVLGDEVRQAIKRRGFNPIEALVGLRNLMLAALPSLAMCDRRDISGQVDSANLGKPTIVVYDRYAGGLGFARTGYELMDTWLEMSGQIVRECPCHGGCPSCVGLANLRPPIHGDPDLDGGYPVPSKDATLFLLEGLSELRRAQKAQSQESV
jgi:DEAD/DEAH box helicase domain-containing protein